MANNWAFATLAELKERIGIAAGDTADDALLTSLLDLTAGSIESAAGRPLRRCHARTEYFTGGSAVIQLDAYPIAKVHSVRESATRDFDTAGAYQELVEGTDFVADPGPGGRYGETGQLRRIGGRWLGSKVAPGCVRVVYTGGYKTDGERGAENATVIVNSLSDVQSYTLLSGSGTLNLATGDDIMVTSSLASVAIVRFDVSETILPVWRPVLSNFLSLYGRYVGSALSVGVWLVNPLDPVTVPIADLVAAMQSSSSLYSSTLSSPTDALLTLTPLGSGAQAAIEAALFNGHVSFALGVSGSTAWSGRISSHVHTILAQRPALTLAHRPSFTDPYLIPDDLRNANLLQSVHEYMTRRTPGMISQATRGTIIPSGASYLKTAADLLPEVQRIALGYRRLF